MANSITPLYNGIIGSKENQDLFRILGNFCLTNADNPFVYSYLNTTFTINSGTFVWNGVLYKITVPIFNTNITNGYIYLYEFAGQIALGSSVSIINDVSYVYIGNLNGGVFTQSIRNVNHSLENLTLLFNRMTSAESKNTTQDSRLSYLEIAVEALSGSGNIFDSVYPVGSIYMSVSSANPSTKFGGTWVAWGAGKVPVGVDTSQTEFSTVEKTGGSKTNTLVANNIPLHTHPITLAASSTIITGLISGVSLSTSSGGSHSHQPLENTGTKNYFVTSSGSTRSTGVMDYTAAENAVSVPGITSKTNQFAAVNGTNDAGSHTHSISSHTHSFTGDSHTHTITGTVGNNTTTTSGVNNLQPYITCYMWKRTA